MSALLTAQMDEAETKMLEQLLYQHLERTPTNDDLNKAVGTLIKKDSTIIITRVIFDEKPFGDFIWTITDKGYLLTFKPTPELDTGRTRFLNLNPEEN